MSTVQEVNHGTIRQEMIALLEKDFHTARDLSQRLRISEKEVYDHLEHIARSISRHERRLDIQPFRCLICGYTFENRKRLTPPGRCPHCRRSHIQAARYGIV